MLYLLLEFWKRCAEHQQSNCWDEWPLPKRCEYHFPPYFVLSVYTCWCHSLVFLPVSLVISFRWHYLSLSPVCHPVWYFLYYLFARLFHPSTVLNIFPLWILAFLISFPSVSCSSDPSFLLPSLLLIDGLAMSHPSSFLWNLPRSKFIPSFLFFLCFLRFHF